MQNNEPLSEFTVDIDPVADGVAGGEYLPQGTNLESLLNSDAAPSDITGEVEVLTYERKGTSVSLSIHSHSDEQQTILLPLLYYRNNVLTSEESSESCEMQVGDNNRTELVIPPHFEGTVQVYYSVPMVWRVASLVSFATFVALMLSF